MENRNFNNEANIWKFKFLQAMEENVLLTSENHDLKLLVESLKEKDEVNDDDQ